MKNNAESPTSSGRESFSDERHEQASQEEQQTDVYRIADLDICSKKILRLVEELLSHIRKTGTQKSTSDEKKTFFVEPASKIGALVSRIINISDEIEDKDNTLEYKQLKLKLYDSISGLFQTAQQAAEPLAPSDALRNVIFCLSILFLNFLKKITYINKIIVNDINSKCCILSTYSCNCL